MTNCYELHIGFPDDERSLGAASSLLHEPQRTSQGWTQSDVHRVHSKDVACLDPHNVPGTLRLLVSRDIPAWDNMRAASPDLPGDVITAADEVLAKMEGEEFADTRLEIEYPLSSHSLRFQADGTFVRAVTAGDPLTIEPSCLQLAHGQLLADTPQWEIHFVAEQVNWSARGIERLDIEAVPAIVERYGVDVEQTIEYRSQSMVKRGQPGFKFISTAYFPGRNTTEREANRLFYKTRLCEEFGVLGTR